ncbi:hypothetical protein [Pseudomonas sp.]|jgi:hypothetical protein|uniref:hypothetical protein n=1 Tax=Pseudomonas sp. TaxID=306 RepID=UPI002ED9E9BF
MKRFISAVALTLIANTSFAQIDAAADPVGANWVSGNFTGVYQMPGQGVLIRMAYDTQTMRYMTNNVVPFPNLQVDSYNLPERTINVSYDWKGTREMGTMEKVIDGVIFTMHDGSQVPMVWVRIATKMDVKKLFCATATGDTPPRGDRGFKCANMTTDQ